MFLSWNEDFHSDSPYSVRRVKNWRRPFRHKIILIPTSNPLLVRDEIAPVGDPVEIAYERSDG